jgi:hypothetical protein
MSAPPGHSVAVKHMTLGLPVGVSDVPHSTVTVISPFSVA